MISLSIAGNRPTAFCRCRYPLLPRPTSPLRPGFRLHTGPTIVVSIVQQPRSSPRSDRFLILCCSTFRPTWRFVQCLTSSAHLWQWRRSTIGREAECHHRNTFARHDSQGNGRGTLASPAMSPALPVQTDPYSLDGNQKQDVAPPWAVPDIGLYRPTSSPTPGFTASILIPSHAPRLPHQSSLPFSAARLSPAHPMVPRYRAYVLVDSIIREICTLLMQYFSFSCIVRHFGTFSAISAA